MRTCPQCQQQHDGTGSWCNPCNAQRRRANDKAKRQARAYGRAQARLRQEHRARFDELYAEELTR